MVLLPWSPTEMHNLPLAMVLVAQCKSEKTCMMIVYAMLYYTVTVFCCQLMSCMLL